MESYHSYYPYLMEKHMYVEQATAVFNEVWVHSSSILITLVTASASASWGACVNWEMFSITSSHLTNWIKHYKLVKLGKLINLLSQHWMDLENQIKLWYEPKKPKKQTRAMNNCFCLEVCWSKIVPECWQ